MPETTQDISLDSQLPPNHSLMCLMGKEGDKKEMWDRTKPTEVESARKTFTELVAKGYRFYQVSKDGSKGEPMTEFDPAAEKMIGVPALVGG